ncbi:MAG: LLM class flavin-dependent oxidoreductase [Chloroflexi bacterium]|nr:LLM class flavin-dependent oxidoreductase [Chloroflexota bacterium]
MQVFAFTLMPWPYLPENYREQYDSAWVTFPNSHFDPVKGHALYTRYIDDLVYAAEAGFDGLGVNEHHQTAYGLMPSPNLMAGMLVQRTLGMTTRIAILGNALPLRDHPLRIAEEIAMLDVISGGRIISGFVRGIGAEYPTFGLNPAHSRERFHEAHDLIVKAWTQPGPFPWVGKHYNFRYVNPWPRPFQQPHPPIWAPSQGSGETIEWAAQHGYTYCQTYSPLAAIAGFFDQYRAVARESGYEAGPQHLAWSVPVYVGRTDEEAREQAWPHLSLFVNDLLRMPPEMFLPPNYTSEASMAKIAAAKKSIIGKRQTMEDMDAAALAIVGSPETVLRKIEAAHKILGFGNLVCIFQFGSMPQDEARANIDRLNEYVLPRVREFAPITPEPAAV